MAVATGHMVYFSAYARSDQNISDKFLKSWNDVTIIPSLLFLVSRFRTLLEVKFHLFWYVKIREMKIAITFTANHWWTRNKTENCLKHMTSSTLVKCKSKIVSIPMPSYPNVTLFLWYVISEHWTTAHTLNMKINHNIP